MPSRSFLLAVWVLSLLYRGIAQAHIPMHVTTSSQHYGPDGPWQAVSISFGDPGQDLDLYPGSAYESIILTDSVCTAVSLQPCGSGGLFSPNRSSTLDDTSIQNSERNKGTDIDWTMGALRISGESHYAMDSLTLYATAERTKTIPSADTRLIYKASITYPDGTEYPPQVGQLALGAATVNQSFDSGDGRPPVNASLVTGYLWTHQHISSSSYALHIGSATLGPPLSLWLGGYDRSRVIGPVSSQSYDGNASFTIDLLDIAIGVDQGASPFPYRVRENILAENNSSMLDSLSVAMNPAGPYLVLPESTCAAIAKDLPVTFNQKYGLYFWNVDDPQYNRIISSPSYLAFIFRASGTNHANLTINVPFQLLNLTLEAPLVGEPTSYLPCWPLQISNPWSGYSLGRAFLQAAFIGVNWNQGVGKWFLAQAPGPNTGSTPDADSYPETFSESSSTPDQWSDSWNGYWKPLPEPTKSSNGTTATNLAAQGLTTGAKLGLGLGIATAALTLIAIAALFFIRRRRRGRRAISVPSASVQDDQSKEDPPYVSHQALNQEPQELSSTPTRTHELHADGVVEMANSEAGSAENESNKIS